MLNNKIFWIATFAFAILLGALLWFGVMPQLATISSDKATLDDINSKIQTEQDYITLVNSINKEKDQLTAISDKAELALPESSKPEIIQLELEGLFKNLNLPLSFSVPYTATAPVATGNVNASDVKPANGATSSASKTTNVISFTISGTINYDQLKTLLNTLKTSTPWNKINELDISYKDNSLSITISANTFWKKASTTFTGGDPKFLEKAKALFDNIQSYASTPDVTKEGNFGRGNPFEPL